MMPLWKKALFSLAAVFIGLAVPYLLIEGVYSVARGPRATTSLAYDLYRRWFAERSVAPYDPHDPTTRMITHLWQFESMMDAMKANGVGIGNSPFHELKTKAVAVNSEQDGCKVQKPNLRKTMAFLRSNLFNPFDQLTYFYDADTTLPEHLAQFLDRYGFRRVRLTTNPYGERMTLPVVSASDKVLVAGDSVANGVMLDDTETISSRLQQADPTRQYINLGISGARTSDTACALERAAQRYPGRVRELIYVFCENDFEEAQPDDIITWLVEFKRREKIDRILLLYVPYIYNAVPEVTRITGHSHRNFPTYREQKRALLAAARQAGFSIIDYVDIILEEERRAGSQFAPLALYLDHTHLSPGGVDRLLPSFAQLHAISGR